MKKKEFNVNREDFVGQVLSIAISLINRGNLNLFFLHYISSWKYRVGLLGLVVRVSVFQLEGLCPGLVIPKTIM